MSILITRARMVEHYLGGLLSRERQGWSNYYSNRKVSTPTSLINRAIHHPHAIKRGHGGVVQLLQAQKSAENTDPQRLYPL